MKTHLALSLTAILGSNFASANVSKWTSIGSPYAGKDDFECSGNNYPVVFPELRGGFDVIDQACSKLNEVISLAIDSQQGWDCSSRDVYQDLLCLEQNPSNPLDEYVSDQVTFKLDQAVTINPGKKKTINLGKVNRPGYVLMYIRSNFDLSTSDIDAISLKIIQTTKSKTRYTLPVLPKIAPYVKSGETITVRNFDGVGNNPGDETMENILIEVMNKSLSPVTLNMADVIVKIRAD